MQEVKSLTCRQIAQMLRSYNRAGFYCMIAVMQENNTDVYGYTSLVNRDELKSKVSWAERVLNFCTRVPSTPSRRTENFNA